MDKPAIEGGTPVRKKMLPYGRQSVDDSDIEAVTQVLQGDWLTTGPAVKSFEDGVKQYCGAAYAVAVNSGTAALHAACHAVGVGQGDEVVVPSITFAATANAVRYCGANPVFADVRPDTLNLNPHAVRDLISSKTKAVIAVDYAGCPAHYDELKAITTEKGIPLIADAAHSLGAKYKGRPVGTLADLTTFSFHPVKVITSAEGGMIVTGNELYANTMYAFRNHGIRSDAHDRAARGDWTYTQEFLGMNYRLSDINCALGLNQLGKLNAWLARRREIAQRYSMAFAELDAVECAVEPAEAVSAWHVYPLRLRLERLSVDRAQVFRALRAEGIGVNVHYIPVYWHPYYENLGYKRGICPVAEYQYERLLTLPVWPRMSENDVEDVVTAVTKVVSWYGPKESPV